MQVVLSLHFFAKVLHDRQNFDEAVGEHRLMGDGGIADHDSLLCDNLAQAYVCWLVRCRQDLFSRISLFRHRNSEVEYASSHRKSLVKRAGDEPCSNEDFTITCDLATDPQHMGWLNYDE
jgi:hypothetical protein